MHVRARWLRRDKSRNGNYAWKTRRLSGHTSPMGYHGLIDRPGMPLLSHTEGGRFITSRESTVWISVRTWRGREGRSGIPDARARARASTSLSLRPSKSRMLAPRRATRVPIESFLCGVHCTIFFLFRSDISDLLGASYGESFAIPNGCAILNHVSCASNFICDTIINMYMHARDIEKWIWRLRTKFKTRNIDLTTYIHILSILWISARSCETPRRLKRRRDGVSRLPC